MIDRFEFADPVFFWLLLALPAIIFFKRRRPPAAVRFSNTNLIPRPPVSWRQIAQRFFSFFPYLAAALLIVGMARPRMHDTQSTVTAEGIDIMLTLDISRSMLIEDLGKLNRLDAAKKVAEEFILNRQSDRIGLVVFAGKSFTQCPLTVDYRMLVQMLNQVQIGLVEDGTAIGMGLINSINRIRDSKSKTKIIILLTDGDNNRGEIDPITAAQIAQAVGIRVYTIGAGKDGIARIPVDDPFFGRQYLTAEVKINEEPLRQIADLTGGKFFRATNQKALADIYEQIGQLEKTKIDVKTYQRYEDLYLWFILPAMILLFFYLAVARTLIVEFP